MRIFLWIIGMIAALMLAFYAYMGGFNTVTVKEDRFGPMEFVYATHKGSYENLSKAWGDFMPKWDAAKLKECLTLGVYLDKPGTPPEKLRTLIGCRIDGWSGADKAAARAVFPSATIPEGPVLTTTFPLRNFLSFFYAPTRVYPEIEKEVAKRGTQSHIAIELYGSFATLNEITFVVPLTQDLSAYQPLYDAFPKD
jgi:hypothetical protein